MTRQEAARALAVKRQELHSAALKLGAVANARGRKPDGSTLAKLRGDLELAARAFVRADEDDAAIAAMDSTPATGRVSNHSKGSDS